MKCPNCGKINDDGNTYCEGCRALLPKNASYHVGRWELGNNCNSSNEYTRELSKSETRLLEELRAGENHISKNNEPTSEALHNVSIGPEPVLICPKCGAVNDIENTYCEHCRTNLYDGKSHPHKQSFIEHLVPRFRIPAFVIGITGVTIGIVLFYHALYFTIDEIMSELMSWQFMSLFFDYTYTLNDILEDFGANILVILLTLVSIILGIVGASKVIQNEISGRYPLLVGGVLTILCIFTSLWYVSISGIIILAAGIFALFTKKSSSPY